MTAERDMYDFEKDWLTKYPYRLSRKFEEKLPRFSSHEEAKNYFEEQFGDDFIPESVDIIDGEKIFFYYLVVHRENFDKFIKELKEKGFSADAEEGALSYHKVEIWENGNVHIVY